MCFLLKPPLFKPIQTLRVQRATSSEQQPAYVVAKEGVYLLIVTIRQKDVILKGNQAYTAQVMIEMKSESGYLSVIDWPLLPVLKCYCIFFFIFLILLWYLKKYILLVLWNHVWSVHSFWNAVADFLLMQMEESLENSNVDRSRPFFRNDWDGN